MNFYFYETQKLSHQVYGKTAVPKTVQDVRQVASNAASGLAR
ncbi:MAG: hypothetical protein ACKOA0_05115 [Burkholderiaceae bacterium]